MARSNHGDLEYYTVNASNNAVPNFIKFWGHLNRRAG